MEFTKFSKMLHFFLLLIVAISCNANKYFSESGSLDSKIDIFNPPGDSTHGQVIIPDLTDITSKIAPDAFIYDQNSEYRKYIMEFRELLNQFDDPVDLAQVIYALSQEPSLNKGIWFRGAISCLVHRQDVNLFTMPRLFEIAPSMTFTTHTMELLKEQSQLPQSLRECVIVDENFGSDNGYENRLWYFREDIMLNSNHWFWHLYYPFNGTELTPADRRGELFYFFHHSMMARYKTERLCNLMPPITPFALEQGATVTEGYRSHLTEFNSRRNWTDRPDNMPLQDRTITPTLDIRIEDAETYRQRILAGIFSESFLASDNSQVPLDNVEGIDILGDVVEASRYSVNPEYYGAFGYHNTGHLFLGGIVFPNNPQGTFIPGVMLDTATAMRDIIFYRWHYHIDSIFQQHKETLEPYQPDSGEFPLSWPDIIFNSIEVLGSISGGANNLRTYWSTTDYTLQNGLDFKRNGSVDVCVKHLNHEQFNYQFNIVSDLDVALTAVIRVFLAPRYNEKGKRYSMREQRNLFFSLDTFSVELIPGENIITRESIDSTLTIPNNSPPRDEECNCGWPDHLLLPKGKPTGMSFDIFGMVTEEVITSIPERRNATKLPPKKVGIKQSGQPCLGAYIYCGILGADYPDGRPMGYPFDRLPFRIADGETSRIVSNLDEYVNPNSNMATATIKIYHYNQIINS